MCTSHFCKFSSCVHHKFLHCQGKNIKLEADSDDIETVFVLDGSHENSCSDTHSEEGSSGSASAINSAINTASTDFEKVPSVDKASIRFKDVPSANSTSSANTDFEEVGITASTSTNLKKIASANSLISDSSDENACADIHSEATSNASAIQTSLNTASTNFQKMPSANSAVPPKNG